MENSTPSNDAKIKDNIETNLLEFSLKFNEKDYNCSLKEIGDRYLKLIVKFDSQKYEGVFNLADFQNMNKNFRIYDIIDELANDLIYYIKENQLKIINIQNNKLILELTIVAKLNNIVIIELNRTDEIQKGNEKENIEIKDKNNYIIDELNIETGEIINLKNRVNNIQYNNKGNFEYRDKKIQELETRLKSLEELLNLMKSQELSFKNIIQESNYNSGQVYVKTKNIMELKKRYKSHKTKNPINEICFFPESGNYIESSGPKIYDKEHNLLISLDDIGLCDHMCIASENSVILTQKNKFILLKIYNAKINSYSYEILNEDKNNSLKNGTITKIIRDRNDGHFIASNNTGIIYFIEMIFPYMLCLEIKHSINTNYKGELNIFLFKEYLIFSADNLYYIKLEDAKNYKEINLKDHLLYNIKPSYLNAITAIDENLNLIGVGCKSNIYILTIDEKETNKLKYTIQIQNETSSIDALCLYQNNILIAGARSGNFYFYSINNGNCQFNKKIEKAHEYNKESETVINGIIELSDGAFATYGGDKKIRIWYI